MYGSPQREIEKRIYKTNNQAGNSAFPFLSLSQWVLQKNYPQQSRFLLFTSLYCLCCPRTEDKSMSSNVRREGWWITNSTVTDTFSAMLLFRVYGRGTKQGGKKLLTERQWVYQPWPREYWAFGICWPHGKDTQRLNNRGPKGPLHQKPHLKFSKWQYPWILDI